MDKKYKILIIKVGHSETLDAEISNRTSFGDVLRSTVILNLFKDDHVTWLVDSKAYPILKNNPYIDRILNYDLSSVLQLQSEHFDTVINMEKVPGLSALADRITAWRRYGFRFDVKKGEAEAYEGSQGILEICKNRKKKRSRRGFWQSGLFEILGKKWRQEEYVFGYKPTSKEKFDIGFNHEVGNKWGLKAWPKENWQELEKLIGNEFSVSWQQGKNDMEAYFDWINSCRVLVTNDSFGMHIAIALKKKLLALFGPTNYREVYLYGRGVKLMPSVSCPEFPCQRKKCLMFEKSCLALITPEQAYKELKILLRAHKDG